MRHFIISDTHFSHENIIRYCNRPFAHADEMDECLIQYWNEVVRPEDHVRHLGDVSMKRGGRLEQLAFIRLIKRLNGHKRLILGNHDHFPTEVYLEAGFEKIQGTGQWLGDGIIYSHYPIHPSNFGRAMGNVHGHVHQNPSPLPFRDNEFENKKVYYNASVEAINYRPRDVEEIRETIRKESR